jgi:hypothetical protein
VGKWANICRSSEDDELHGDIRSKKADPQPAESGGMNEGQQQQQEQLHET